MTHPYRVLLVDDETLILELLVEALSPLGFALLTATDAVSALELLRKKKPDAVLSDVHMPGMSGFDLIKKARESEILTPFVFLTGYGDKQKAITALRLGAFDFLEKPFAIPQLREVITMAVKLGASLKSVEDEIDEAARKVNLPPEGMENFRKAKRAILKLKKNLHVRKAG